MDAYRKYKQVAEDSLQQFPEADYGKMMSAEAIIVNKKVFAFFYKNEMCFRLGENFPIADYNLDQWHHLNPFKKKVAMKAWFCISEQDSRHWKNSAKKHTNLRGYYDIFY